MTLCSIYIFPLVNKKLLENHCHEKNTKKRRKNLPTFFSFSHRKPLSHKESTLLHQSTIHQIQGFIPWEILKFPLISLCHLFVSACHYPPLAHIKASFFSSIYRINPPFPYSIQCKFPYPPYSLLAIALFSLLSMSKPSENTFTEHFIPFSYTNQTSNPRSFLLPLYQCLIFMH